MVARDRCLAIPTLFREAEKPRYERMLSGKDIDGTIFSRGVCPNKRRIFNTDASHPRKESHFVPKGRTALGLGNLENGDCVQRRSNHSCRMQKRYRNTPKDLIFNYLQIQTIWKQ